MSQFAKHSNMIIHVPSIFIFCFIFSWINFMAMAGDQNTTNYIPVNVGVVVDVNTQSGKIWLSCIKMAHSDFYASHAYHNTRLVINTRDSKQSVVGAAAAALDLIENEEVEAILAPVTSMQASFLVDLGGQAHVPIISFSTSSTSLTSLGSSYFFRITQTDSHQVQAISSIVQNCGWRQVVPIYVDDTYGQGVIPFLIDALQEIGAHVPYRSVISPSATDDQIEKELYKLMTMQTRVFIVHMMPGLYTRLFAKAKEIGMISKGYVWIMTNGVGNSLRSMGSALNSMQGVLGVETYIPRTPELRELVKRWKRQLQQDNPTIIDVEMDVFGFRAYDATFALAMAVEKVGYRRFDLGKGINASFDSTDLDTYKVSQYGPKLSHALSVTKFRGIAGDFILVDGQLQSSTLKIVNVNGDRVRSIAVWTPENGIARTLNISANTRMFSTSKCDLGPIRWPGDSPSVPKGFEIPTNGKKMRIGIPLKDGFTEFVRVTKDPKTNRTDVTGFSTDVFKAAVEILPYALPYEFIPYAGTYSDLVYQVYLGIFDFVIGDTTIRANRSLYVDFTMPYTKSDIVMVVPIIDTRGKNGWVFFKPFTWGLWVTIICFSLYIGFVVWVLEHRINEDFGGPPLQQVSTSLLLSFSSVVISHTERLVNNSARFVMTIWLLVMLILTQGYGANLVTVQQLKPTVTKIDDLLRNGDTVGYIKNSFVYEVLTEMGFDHSKLKVMKSMEECHEALSKGSAKGGIAAVIDESPNMKLFVAKYCPKYIMIGPILKTDGYAFVFAKGSNILPDVSQAILKVTEGKKIMNIEDKWFKKYSNCQDSTPNVSDDSLGVDRIWGLFVVAGVASILALIIFVALLLYKHRHVLMHPDSRASTWTMIRAILKIFNERDLSCAGDAPDTTSVSPGEVSSEILPTNEFSITIDREMHTTAATVQENN